MEKENPQFKSLEVAAYQIELGAETKNLAQYYRAGKIKSGLATFHDSHQNFDALSICSIEKEGQWRETLALNLEGKIILIEEGYERGNGNYEVVSQTPFVDYLKQGNNEVNFFSEGHVLDGYTNSNLDEDFRNAYVQLLLENGYGAHS